MLHQREHQKADVNFFGPIRAERGLGKIEITALHLRVTRETFLAHSHFIKAQQMS